MKLLLLILIISAVQVSAVLTQDRLFKEVDSTKTYKGNVVLDDFSNRSSQKITILKDRILINNYPGATAEELPFDKVRMVRLEMGNYFLEGAGLGFLFGFALSLDALLDDEIKSDTKTGLFLVITSISTAAGGIIGAMTSKINSYLIRNYSDVGLNINHSYIDKSLDISQVSIGINIQL